MLRRQKSKLFLYLIAAALLLFAVARLYYRLTDDFRLTNIHFDQPYRPGWEISTLEPSELQYIKAVLQQPYRYLGKGAQSYAFVSEDRRYVLKFFKFKHLRPNTLLEWLSPLKLLEDYRIKQSARKLRKLEGVFAGYHLAYERHRQDSGLVVIHLNPTQSYYGYVNVRDKIGFSHHIDLDELPFVLQYKVDTFRETMQRLLKQGDVEGAKIKIAKIFDLYQREYAKGIVDHDHGVMRNIGFLGQNAIHLDVGKLHSEESIMNKEAQAKDLALMSSRLKGWLQAHEVPFCKELCSYVDQLYDQAASRENNLTPSWEKGVPLQE